MKRTALFTMCLLIFSLSFTPNTVMAETNVTVNLEDLSKDAAAEVIKKNKEKQEVPTTLEKTVGKVNGLDPENINKYVDVLGNALQRFCQILNIEVNSLLTSTAGIGLAALIVWNYGGVQVLNIVVGILASAFLYLTFIPVWIWSYRKCHFKYKIAPFFFVWSKSKEEIAEPLFTDEARMVSIFLHVIVFIIMTVICIALAFGGW